MPAPRPCSTPTRARLIAQESQAMKRGHAEALMPLIARVMKAVRHRLRRARPHRGHHRPRQLHRLARRPFGRARHRARRRQAGGRRDHADGLRRARRQRERRASDHLRDRCAARPCLFPGGERQRQLAGQAAGRADRGSARRRALRRAASGRQRRARFSPTAGRRDAPPPFKVDAAGRRPISPGWRGSAPRSARRRRRPGRYYLRAPDAKPPKDPLPQAHAAPAS